MADELEEKETSRQAAETAQPAEDNGAQAVETQPAQTDGTQGEIAENQTDSEQTPAQDDKKEKNGRVFFYIAIACTALGALFFGLTFTPLAVFSLCASILFCLASLSFLNTQKKKENFKGVLILTIITYILFGIFLAFFIGGVIWSIIA